jgi:hypothetical protein
VSNWALRAAKKAGSAERDRKPSKIRSCGRQ